MLRFCYAPPKETGFSGFVAVDRPLSRVVSPDLLRLLIDEQRKELAAEVRAKYTIRSRKSEEPSREPQPFFYLRGPESECVADFADLPDGFFAELAREYEASSSVTITVVFRLVSVPVRPAKSDPEDPEPSKCDLFISRNYFLLLHNLSTLGRLQPTGDAFDIYVCDADRAPTHVTAHGHPAKATGQTSLDGFQKLKPLRFAGATAPWNLILTTHIHKTIGAEWPLAFLISAAPAGGAGRSSVSLVADAVRGQASVDDIVAAYSRDPIVTGGLRALFFVKMPANAGSDAVVQPEYRFTTYYQGDHEVKPAVSVTIYPTKKPCDFATAEQKRELLPDSLYTDAERDSRTRHSFSLWTHLNELPVVDEAGASSASAASEPAPRRTRQVPAATPAAPSAHGELRQKTLTPKQKQLIPRLMRTSEAALTPHTPPLEALTLAQPAVKEQSVMIAVPLYNEDASALHRTIRSLWSQRGLKRHLFVVIILDGWDKAHPSMRKLLAKMFPDTAQMSADVAQQKASAPAMGSAARRQTVDVRRTANLTPPDPASTTFKQRPWQQLVRTPNPREPETFLVQSHMFDVVKGREKYQVASRGDKNQLVGYVNDVECQEFNGYNFATGQYAVPDLPEGEYQYTINYTLVVKRDNRRKHNSHEWFFQLVRECRPYSAFCTDGGTVLGKDLLATLVAELRRDDSIAATTGRQRVMSRDLQTGEKWDNGKKFRVRLVANPSEGTVPEVGWWDYLASCCSKSAPQTRRAHDPRRRQTDPLLSKYPESLFPQGTGDLEAGLEDPQTEFWHNEVYESAADPDEVAESRGFRARWLRNVQLYDYEASLALFVGPFALLGMLPVIPGPCGLFRTSCLVDSEHRPLDQYFEAVEPDEIKMVSGNLLLAEDRILTYVANFLTSSGKGPMRLTWCPEAVFYYESESEARMLLPQRRRWTNGSIAGYHSLITEHADWMEKSERSTPMRWAQRGLLRLVYFLYFLAMVSPALFASALVTSLEYVNTHLVPTATTEEDPTGQPEFGDMPYWTVFGYMLVYAAFVFMHSSQDPKRTFVPWMFYVCVALNVLAMLLIFGTLVAGTLSTFDFNINSPTFLNPDSNSEDLSRVRLLLTATVIVMLVLPYFLALLYGGVESMMMMVKATVPFMAFLPTMVATFSAYAVARSADLSWGNRPSTDLAEEQKDKIEIFKTSQTACFLVLLLNFVLTGTIVLADQSDYVLALLFGVIFAGTAVMVVLTLVYWLLVHLPTKALRALEKRK
eukprot:TRINITY_DN9053_c0_g1_i5.p1 TRINITY_DN9053_c0_g1~~TRINITY_DN9053_c0_g1_i5.p1  ORF type:complete len:1253 (+),score=336.12 TRINITY_DN9053_c0_g1_i5:3-3761(+)